MRNIFTFIILLSFTQIIFGQILVENFDYDVDTKLTVSPNWSESPTGSTDVTVKNGNLNYTNYVASNIGNMIGLNGGASGRSGVLLSFNQIMGDGSKLYASFLLKVISTTDLDSVTTTKDYFAAFRDTSRNVKRAYIYLKNDSSGGNLLSKYSIGLAKTGTSNLIWYETELNVDSTYLIVINYVFNSGNDFVKLWINPILSNSEPAADIVINTGSDADSLGGFQFLQQSESGDEDIDGLTIATDWSSLIAVIEDVIDENGVPSKFELLQNYPNPFNPTTVIKYSIPVVESGYIPTVLLKIYDILGREIKTLVNEKKASGNYKIIFNANGLPSGMYFYRLSTNTGFVQTKKMMLLK